MSRPDGSGLVKLLLTVTIATICSHEGSLFRFFFLNDVSVGCFLPVFILRVFPSSCLVEFNKLSLCDREGGGGGGGVGCERLPFPCCFKFQISASGYQGSSGFACMRPSFDLRSFSGIVLNIHVVSGFGYRVTWMLN